MANYLLVDIGSTYTKLTAVDLEKEDIIATSKYYTTIESDVKEGYLQALEILRKNSKQKLEFEKVYACSSAAGGLKMAAIGLVEELTVEAAKRVCLNAGGKVDLVFSQFLTKAEVAKIKEENIDIVLLAGGTDGGNSEVVLHNARMLGEANLKIPLIYAGNKSAQDEILETFHEYAMNGYICENVMPKLNVLNIEASREVIKKIFLENIIEAKGISNFAREIDGQVIPTPQAVLMGCELLSRGYLEETGLGDLILVDIGGATTDIYSLSKGLPRTMNTIIKGLEEPYAKRTVEGDLGMRYSALGIIDNLSPTEINSFQKKGLDILAAARERSQNVELIPRTEQAKEIDNELARICADKAFSRHVGKLTSVYTPLGVMNYQEGKDLSDVQNIIGTGGVLVHSNAKQYILEGIKTNQDEPMELRPKEADLYIDEDYILSAMGLLSQVNPSLAIKIMKKRIKRIDL